MLTEREVCVMAMENSGRSFGAFSKLLIDQSDVSGSWKTLQLSFCFLQSFENMRVTLDLLLILELKL